MSLSRHKNQRDENEPEIVAIFKAHGISVTRLDQPCDLLLGYKGHTFLCEVKMPKGGLTPAQWKFLKTWRGQMSIVWDTETAQALIEQIKANDAPAMNLALIDAMNRFAKTVEHSMAVKARCAA